MTSTAQRLSFTTDCFVKWWKWNQHHHITSVVRTYTHMHTHTQAWYIYRHIGLSGRGNPANFILLGHDNVFVVCIHDIRARMCSWHSTLSIYIVHTRQTVCFVCVCMYTRRYMELIFHPTHPLFIHVSCSGRIYSSNSRQGKNCTTLGIKCIQNIVSCICIRKILITDNTI